MSTRSKHFTWWFSAQDELEKIERNHLELIRYAVKNKNRKEWYPAFGWENYGKTGL